MSFTSPAGLLLRQVASEKGDELWFVAKDVCDALGLKNVSQACAALRDKEKMTITIGDSHSGQRGGAQKATRRFRARSLSADIQVAKTRGLGRHPIRHTYAPVRA